MSDSPSGSRGSDGGAHPAGAASARRVAFAADAAETERIGEALGQCAAPGTVVLLIGNLGAGKTTLARGVGRGLAIRTVVQSPTFALVHEHKGRLLLAHMDFYRLDSPAEIDTIGIDEYLEGGGVTLIEWPEIAMDRLPDSRLEVRLSEEGTGRRVEMTAFGIAVPVLEAMKGAL